MSGGTLVATVAAVAAGKPASGVPDRGASPRRARRADAVWVVAVVVVGLGLAAGAGAFSSGHSARPSLYQRALQIDGQYRCPVCQGETVAASDAPEAVAIKQMVQGWLSDGRSPAEIRAYLLQRYGRSILEEPPASGTDLFLWALPILAVALAATGLGLAFSRWRRPAVAAVPGAPVAEEPGDRGPAADFGTPSPPQVSRVRLAYQRATLVGGVALVLFAGALWLVDKGAAPRGAGGTATGGASGLPAELQQAVALTPTDPSAALALYDEALSEDPGQVIALTGEGWIYAEAGFVQKGAGLLAAAEHDDPSYGPAHFYRALVLLDYSHQPAAAAKELEWYLAHSPDRSTVPTARKALSAAEGGTWRGAPK